MANHNLTTNIQINAKTNDKDFAKLQAELQAAVDMAQQISDALIGFGKDSSEVYGQFEWNMAQARAYMSNNVQMAGNLGQVMDDLYVKAVEWADTTIFTTGDISSAILGAAQAGWSYEEMLNGIPSAMLLAQASGLSLSQSLGYIITMANSTRTPLSDIGRLVDQWTVAASNGATSIGELGEAVSHMGASSQFAYDSAELLTMLTLLSNYGYKGSDAGTLLRNTMIRLAAPTGKAKDELYALGFTAEQVEEALGDDGDGLIAAMETLGEAGFSVYDSEGNLKSYLQIFQELAAATAKMGDDERYALLKDVFGAKSISGAMSLMSALDRWGDVYNAVLSSDGSAQRMSDIMMDTQMADLELMEARLETLKLRVGSEITEDVRILATAVSGFIDSINNMDDAQFSALVSGLETIALAGAGLGAVAAALKVMSSLGVVGGLTLLGVAVAGLTTYFNELEEINFEDMFGTMTVDENEIMQYVDTIGTEFADTAASVKEFNAQLDNISKNYGKASGTLSSKLLTKALTGAVLTQPEIAQLLSLGDDMYGYILSGIQTGKNAQLSFWSYILGERDEEGLLIVQGIINKGYLDAMAQAQQLGEDLRSAMTKAFEDGVVTEQEYEDILNYMRAYNAAMARAAAQAQSEQDLMDAQVEMRKSQGMSLQGIQSASGKITSQRDASLDAMDTAFWTNYYTLQRQGASQEQLDALEAAYFSPTGKRMQHAQAFDDILFTLWRSGLYGSDLWEDYTAMQGVAGDLMAGNIGVYDALDLSNYKDLYKYAYSYVAALGGSDELMRKIDSYKLSGNMEMANQLSELLMILTLLQNSGGQAQTEFGAMAADPSGRTKQLITGVMTQLQPVSDAESVAGEISVMQQYADQNPIVVPVKLEFEGMPANSSGVNYLLRDFIYGSSKQKFYAEGGRASEASIFGEAGPEWAIPEEHSNRTAMLLNEARAASGFTWAELLARSGGLNADANRTPTTVIYSPTINAGDASGVEEALMRDKALLEKWWKGMNARERMVSFA